MLDRDLGDLADEHTERPGLARGVLVQGFAQAAESDVLALAHVESTVVGDVAANRANVKGVFIFRFENPAALPEQLRPGAPLTAEGKVPVIYRLDMSDPATFFVMQTFPMRDKDILYVSNAPAVDFQKFANLISQMTFSISSMISAVP